MSTTSPETSPKDTVPVTDPIPVSQPVSRPIETAPSAMHAEAAAFPRLVGFIGLVFLVLGAAAVISTRAVGPRLVSEGLGFLFAAGGLALMLYHAIADGEQEIRRLYGGFAVFWLLFGVVAAIAPGPIGSGSTDKEIGHYLLPWGVGAAFLGLLFSIPFCRHETDETYRTSAVTVLLVFGGLLSVGAVAAGVFKPEFLIGPGLTLAILGLAFLCAYLGQVDTSDGIGFTVAFTLGAFGAATVAFSIGRAAFPTLLFEGPTVLRDAYGSLDVWRVLFRLLGGFAFAVPLAYALATRSAPWLKIATGVFALVGIGVVVTSLFANPVHTAPKPFLVPNGLILVAVGLTYLAVSVGVCSDNQIVTLTRRELASYFLSPMGYLVLAGMALIEWNQYRVFVNELARAGGPMPEPIVVRMFLDFLPVIALLLQVPILTMRLVAEERRTGTLEVLLTAPVNEWPVIFSKFLATWLFFLICWLPAGLFLIALRLEVPVPFDYRPLLSFYLCIAAQGLAFVGLGLLLSTLTKNQIVAAALALVMMIMFFVCFIIRRDPTSIGLPDFVQAALGRFSYVHMWIEALSGRLPLRDVLLFASLGVFSLFLSVKVLETRKWS